MVHCQNPISAMQTQDQCISKLFDTLMVFLKEFFKKVDVEKKSADDNKSMKNYPVCKELSIIDDDKAWLIDAMI